MMEADNMPLQSAPRKRVIIVGASETGLALARSLCTTWNVTVLDLDSQRLLPLWAIIAPEAALKLLAKDGTSLLNLREAGVSESEWIIAATSTDEVNVEICRLALSVEHPPAAIAVVQSTEAQSQLKALGAEVLLRPLAMAGLVTNVIERGVRIAVSVGLGRGEVLEIPVLPTSPAVDMRVADLRARRWLIAAIYRQDQIIVPHGNAVVRAGDRLLLSGEPDILPDIADYLRAGVARFPLQYGRQLVFAEAGVQNEGVWREVAYLADKTRVDGVTLLPAPATAVQRPEIIWPRPLHTLEGQASAGDMLQTLRTSIDLGVLVLAKPKSNWGQRMGLWSPSWPKLLIGLGSPLLLAAGNSPYGRVVLAATESSDLTLAAELAIDVARQLGLPLHAVTVSTPDFVAGGEQTEAHERVLRTVRDVAAQYRVSVTPHHLNGNPVREVARFVVPSDLLVVTHRGRRRSFLLNPDVGALLVEQAACSVLILGPRSRTRSEVGR